MTQSTELPLLDPALLEGIWQVAPDRAAKLMGYYLEDLPQQINGIVTALQGDDTTQVGNIAHSLKSSSRQLGALQLGEAAYLVEQAARSTPPALQQLPVLVNQLQRLVSPTVHAINRDITRHIDQFPTP